MSNRDFEKAKALHPALVTPSMPPVAGPVIAQPGKPIMPRDTGPNQATSGRKRVVGGNKPVSRRDA